MEKCKRCIELAEVILDEGHISKDLFCPCPYLCQTQGKWEPALSLQFSSVQYLFVVFGQIPTEFLIKTKVAG